MLYIVLSIMTRQGVNITLPKFIHVRDVAQKKCSQKWKFGSFGGFIVTVHQFSVQDILTKHSIAQVMQPSYNVRSMPI